MKSTKSDSAKRKRHNLKELESPAFRKIALLGPPLHGKLTAIKALERRLQCKAILQVKSAIPEIEIELHDAHGFPQKSIFLKFPILDSDPPRMVKIQTFSGSLFYPEAAVQILLQDASEVWFIVKSTGFIFADSIITTDYFKTSCLECLELVLTEAARLKKLPSQIPWRFILNKKESMIADDDYYRKHPLVKSKVVSFYTADVQEDLSHILM